MAKKQTFVVGSTNPITASKTDAQLNVGWDQFEVLNAEDLDGVFNAVSAQSQINSEEITNALDVYNMTPDPTDNTQLKQILTTMDNKIDQVSSGDTIIASFWFGKTTANFSVPAPTEIGQNYIDFTTLEYYVSNDGSTWTLDGTLTLLTLQNSVVLITSKFWDIVEQQDQYGGRAIWSPQMNSWTYFPNIVSIDLSNYVTTTALATMFQTLYPVGSIYIGTQNTCPLATLIPGSTWQLVATNRALWGGDGTNAATTIAAGLPNITGADAISHSQQTAGALNNNDGGTSRTGALQESQFVRPAGTTIGTYNHQQFSVDLPVGIAINASLSSSVYGQSSTVQPPAYRVNVWRRTA